MEGFTRRKNNRLSVFPIDREEVCFAPHYIVSVAIGAYSKEYGIPITCRSLHQIGMAGTSDRIRTVLGQVTLCQYRVGTARLERAERRGSREDDLAMIGTCTAFGCHQVVSTVDMVKVRAFYPTGMLRFVYTAVYNHFLFSCGTVIFPVEFAYPDSAVPAVFRFSGRGVVVYNIGFTIFIKQESGVYTAYFG